MAETTDKAGAMYAERDHEELGDYYIRHVSAMTTEGLHAKSDIAAELAWRDSRIAELEWRCERLQEIAVTFLPVMEAARPLVLNLERLRDAATEAK